MSDMSNFVEPNVNNELGKEITIGGGVAGVAFFKKTGEKDSTHGFEILEPLSEEELETLKTSEDPKKTLMDKEWERVLCIETIDPEFKGIHRKGYVRLIFFEDGSKPMHVYLDGEPQMNLATKYVWLKLHFQGHIQL